MSEQKPFKPMLAVKAVTINYPVYASAKIDGVRVVIKDDMALSRTLKPIPNAFVQQHLGLPHLNGLDGEITVGPANVPTVMQATTSGVMSEEGQPDFTYWVFDYWTDTKGTFAHRLQIMQRCFKDDNGPMNAHPRIKLLRQVLCRDVHELNGFEALMLEQGFEGVMIRDPNGRYKYGRSTAKEGALLKVKRFTTDEAVIVGVEERMHNTNEATINELGRTERSSAKAGLVPTGMVGSFRVLMHKGDNTSCSFNVSRGRMTDEEARRLWEVRSTLVGKIITFSHFAVSGVKDVPRFPIFHSFRDPIDIGEPK